MTEEFLDRTKVCAALEKVSGKRVPQRVRVKISDRRSE
jgi:hypothetical protein